MKRDLKKYVEEFEKRYNSGKNVGGYFFYSDIKIISGMSGYDIDREWNLICNSLMSGFMIGYRKAQRDYRKKNRKRKIGETT